MARAWVSLWGLASRAWARRRWQRRKVAGARLATTEADYENCKRHVAELNKAGAEAMVSGQRIQGAMTVLRQMIEEAEEAEALAAGIAVEDPADSGTTLAGDSVQ